MRRVNMDAGVKPAHDEWKFYRRGAYYRDCLYSTFCQELAKRTTNAKPGPSSHATPNRNRR
jgi:hypothetical protein